MKGINPPPFWKKNIQDVYPDYEGKVDRWQIIHFEAPSTINIDVGVAKAGTGAPEGDRSQGVNGFVMNTITPESSSTSHYFWSFQRNYRLKSQLITTQLREGVTRVFGEDEDMLRAQQKAIEANPDYEFYNLNIDAGGMWVRRLLEKMLLAEGRLGTRAEGQPGNK
jgi:vanillate O-demethylase monooxygenase subunit